MNKYEEYKSKKEKLEKHISNMLSEFSEEFDLELSIYAIPNYYSDATGHRCIHYDVICATTKKDN